ncbi:MAG: type II CRISPR RNA-guided endonuclease Cas9 [bacterium]
MPEIHPETRSEDLILGLDIGTNSVGWSLVRYAQSQPEEIVALGSRVFDAGMEGSITHGKEESRNKKRRDARSLRRATWRRKRRKRSVYRLLQESGLLPEVDISDSDAINVALTRLDQELCAKLTASGDHREAQLMPYLARIQCTKGPVDPFVLGRSLYHIAQRRGFQSNRRTAVREDEDLGQVKSAIAALAEDIRSEGGEAETLGGYFASLDPNEERIRTRWTGREMYRDEFERIVATQRPHHDSLSDERVDALRAAIFNQRPLRSQKHLVGTCELERKQRRCSIALLEYQRFRLLQTVNNLRWLPDGGAERDFTREERCRLVDELHVRPELSFAKLRELLGLKRNSGRFNLELGGEKRIVGNRTNSRLRSFFEDSWDQFSDDERASIVHDLLSIQNPAALERRAVERWRLDPERSSVFANDLLLEEGYAPLSLQAIRKLLPRLEEGIPYSTVRKEVYPDSFRPSVAMDRLPPLARTDLETRNPAITRTVSEVRGVVNAIIRQYGRPGLVRIELARDLKQPRRRRQEISRQMRDREKVRERAKKKLLDSELGSGRASRADIEKIILAEECDWTCPYTGRGFGMTDLFGPSPTIDVEHILPFSRCLDNSFLNKTLCDLRENRLVKRNRTPFESYAGDPARWEDVLDRVRNFKSDPLTVRRKLERFSQEELSSARIDEFSERALSDTRYASRLVADYVGLLYGGRVDCEGRQRVQVSSGQATAILRREWGLNALLGGEASKTRLDHRHHAIDATVIALTGPREVKRLADAAKRAADRGSHRLFEEVPLPWSRFRTDVNERIHGCVTSRRPSRRLRGPLHEETLYSRPLPWKEKNGKETRRPRIRKPIEQLSKGEIKRIADPAVRDAVEQELADFVRREEGKADASKVFSDPSRIPSLDNRDGSKTPIRRVRIAANVKQATPIGSGPGRRYVAPGSNHHMAIVAFLDEDGNEKRWEGHVVTMLEAVLRKGRGEPVVQRDWGEGRRFRFSLRSGDCVWNPDTGRVMHVKAVSSGVVECLDVNDARSATDVRAAGAAGGRYTASPERLRRDGLVRCVVEPLGGITASNE